MPLRKSWIHFFLPYSNHSRSKQWRQFLTLMNWKNTLRSSKSIMGLPSWNKCQIATWIPNIFSLSYFVLIWNLSSNSVSTCRTIQLFIFHMLVGRTCEILFHYCSLESNTEEEKTSQKPLGSYITPNKLCKINGCNVKEIFKVQIWNNYKQLKDCISNNKLYF